VTERVVKFAILFPWTQPTIAKPKVFAWAVPTSIAPRASLVQLEPTVFILNLSIKENLLFAICVWFLILRSVVLWARVL